MSYQLRPNLIMREVAGSVIIIPVGEQVLDLNGIMTLNATARCLWERLAQGATHAELVATLVAHFDVSDAIAVDDVTAFLDELTAKRLLCDDRSGE